MAPMSVRVVLSIAMSREIHWRWSARNWWSSPAGRPAFGQFIRNANPRPAETIGNDMCGIVGILGNAPVAASLVAALRRLEYRGYDSAGIATLETSGLERLRAPGKLAELESKLNGRTLNGSTGIGHTRWATHGAPNETN